MAVSKRKYSSVWDARSDEVGKVKPYLLPSSVCSIIDFFFFFFSSSMLGLLPLDSCLELHKAPPVFFGRKMVENLFCHIDGIIPRVSSCTFVQYLCGVQFCTVTNNTAKCIIAHGFFVCCAEA